MGELLNPKEALFERDENGSLLPVELPLRILNKENPPIIKVIPISRGKWRRMMEMGDEEQDLVLINEHIVEPKFTVEDYKAMKQKYMNAINIAFVKLTLDIEDKDIEEEQKKELTKAEEFMLKKKSVVQEETQSSSCTETDTTITQ